MRVSGVARTFIQAGSASVTEGKVVISGRLLIVYVRPRLSEIIFVSE